MVAGDRSKALMAREVNGRVLEVARTFGELVPSERSLLAFVCECTRQACYERLELTAAEYEEAHDGAERFVILASHKPAEGEAEILRTDRYAVVERPAA